jgi:hypothetical protein
MRLRALSAGILLAIIAGVLVTHGETLGGQQLAQAALIAVAGGGLVGLVPAPALPWRAGAFAIGFLIAGLTYLIRAGMLPDIPIGRGLGAVIAISLVTAMAVASAERLPLWAGLAGLATFSGTYEITFNATPSTVMADLPAAFTAAALAAAVGLLVGGVLSEVPDDRFDRPGRSDGAHADGPPRDRPPSEQGPSDRTPSDQSRPTGSASERRGGGIEVVAPSKSEANPS